VPEEQRRVEIREILKNKLIVLNQVAIKIAAEEFMQALLDWKSERTIRETIAPYRPEWGEQEILNCIERSESLINPIIKVYPPVYDVAIQKKSINHLIYLVIFILFLRVFIGVKLIILKLISH